MDHIPPGPMQYLSVRQTANTVAKNGYKSGRIEHETYYTDSLL